MKRDDVIRLRIGRKEKAVFVRRAAREGISLTAYILKRAGDGIAFRKLISQAKQRNIKSL